MNRLQKLMKMTSVRLSIIYLLLFSFLALGLVFYVSYNTGRLIISQVRAAAEDEVRELSNIYRSGGARSLIRSIDRRSRNPGANLYLISERTGRIITGNVKSVDPKHLQQVGWSSVPFPYEPFAPRTDGEHRAIAQIFSLPDGLRLLVGRDIGDAVRFRGIVVEAAGIALAAMFIIGILLWFFIGRRALKRVDEVSRASESILAGDLSERLPVSGSADEFDRLSTSLNALIGRVEKLNTGVRSVSDAIAHDLKTPLARLRNDAETGLKNLQKGDAESIDAFNAIIKQSDGLIKTFDALLKISQISSGAQAVELTEINITKIAEDVFELFEPSAQEQDVNFELDCEPNVSVNGHRELFAQAMSNLIDNALKYGCSADTPILKMSLHRLNDQVRVTISDNGGGVAEEFRERVKERFFRVDKSRSSEGSGLGLSLVEAIVGLHRGQLELKDNEPGLRVEITLPV